MLRKQVLIPAEIRDAASADLAAVMARRRAFRERVEKDQRCTDAVKAFRDATVALWSAQPKEARPLVRAVHQTLLGATKALAEAGRLEAWKQTDHEATYNGYRIRNHRVMSRLSYDWAGTLLAKACEGQLPKAILRETWETESLQDAIHWLRIFLVGLSGEGAILPRRQDRVPPPPPAPQGPTAGQNAQEVVQDLALVAAGQQRGCLSGPRLSFDAETWTATLDGMDYRIDDPKQFQIYRVIAEVGRPITNSEIQGKVMGVKGKKAISKRLQSLPPALRRTIRTNTRGHWLVLPIRKK
jgi:hypothetical protein